MVRERHRLRALQVRVARHHRVDLGLGALEQCDGQRLCGAIELVEQLDHQQPEVERDLVVAAARGVELAAHRTCALGEDALDR